MQYSWRHTSSRRRFVWDGTGGNAEVSYLRISTQWYEGEWPISGVRLVVYYSTYYLQDISGLFANDHLFQKSFLEYTSTTNMNPPSKHCLRTTHMPRF